MSTSTDRDPDEVAIDTVNRDRETAHALFHHCTVYVTEQLIRTAVEHERSYLQGLCRSREDWQRAVEHYDADRFHSSQPLTHAIVAGYFVAAELGIRLGAKRAEELMKEAQEFSENTVAVLAPWLLAGEDDE